MKQNGVHLGRPACRSEKLSQWIRLHWMWEIYDGRTRNESFTIHSQSGLKTDRKNAMVRSLFYRLMVSLIMYIFCFISPSSQKGLYRIGYGYQWKTAEASIYIRNPRWYEECPWFCGKNPPLSNGCEALWMYTAFSGRSPFSGDFCGYYLKTF